MQYLWISQQPGNCDLLEGHGQASPGRLLNRATVEVIGVNPGRV